MKKNYILLLFVGILVLTACSKSKEELLQGTWRLQSSKNLKKNRVIKTFGDDDLAFAIINQDSIILTDDLKELSEEVYLWEMMEDSLKIMKPNRSQTFFVQIHTLTEDSLIVDLNFYRKIRLTFDRFL